MTEKTLISFLALQHAPTIGDITAKKLIVACGAAEAVFEEKKRTLLKIDGIGERTIAKLFDTVHFKAAERELKFIKDNNIKCFSFEETEYPERLKHCVDGPILIFCKGNIAIHKERKIISIVGTRQNTSYGTTFCEQLLEEIAPLDPIIVSGYAYGIDIVAHRAAIKNGLQTIGCLAHGLNQIYPKVHERYNNQMEANGGFITDFWSTSNPDRENFLKRNRIIAGLSEATIVIESAEKGGSLVTADIAHSYNREVFAVPGRNTDKFSEGCNNLIKSQKAHMLTSAADLVYILGWDIDEKKKNVIQKKLFSELDTSEKKVYSFLEKKGKKLLDEIALECQLPIHKTSTLLLNMELKGAVRPLPGKLFEAI
ncbi:DNA-processing protein DprA [Leptobacterium sp. I13]|uniref:DNA-processing protein DprA n=1 Tax=Leptobacterium meishanense TaxID=3128904 RepID=UPI0030EC06B8